MPSEPVLLHDAIVLKLAASGEKFVQASLISRSHGIVKALNRRRSPGHGFAIDLFDQGEAKVEIKAGTSSGFLADFACQQKRLGIGKSYKTLEAASWLSNFLLANPLHDENRESTFELARRAFNALDSNLPSRAILLKSLFVYSRDEGYPVIEDWARNLEPTLSQVVSSILNTPLASLECDPALQQTAFASLAEYVERHTHIYLNSR